MAAQLTLDKLDDGTTAELHSLSLNLGLGLVAFFVIAGGIMFVFYTSPLRFVVCDHTPYIPIPILYDVM